MPNNIQISKDHLIDLSDLATEAKGNLSHLSFLFDEVNERISQLKSYIKAGNPLQLDHFNELDKLLNISIELSHLYETRFADLQQEYKGE